MKKYILILLTLILLTGCSNDTNTLNCELGNEKMTFKFEKGQLVKYIENDKEKDKEYVDEMNGYLTNVKDNKEAITKIKNVIISFNGTCD